MAAKNKSNEIRIIREYDAPVKAVWDAWTDPEQAAEWWGPRGFTITTHSKDLRPGGNWRYTMHGPDGVDYPNVTQYLEVEPLKKLVYDHGGNDDQPPIFRVTVVFSDINGKTKMDMRMALPTQEAAEEARMFIKAAGGNGTWDRLAEYLEKESSGKEKFVINRTFEAPLELMFEMWTKPEHLAQWLPPTGATMKFIRPGIKPGERAFYSMTNADNSKMYGTIEYVEITKPSRIVYKQQFRDAEEKLTRPPMLPVWPETMLTTVTLTAEESDQTRVTVIWEPYGATNEELEVFVDMKGSMTQGWTGSFDKLDDLLSN